MSDVLSIEPLSPAAFPLAARWLSEPENNKWLTSDWRDHPVDSTVLGIAVRNKKNRLYLVRCNGQPCGLVALADLDLTDRIAMIWYVLGEKSAAGRGVTTSAVRKLLHVAFDELQLESVHAWVMEDNIASRRVLEKAEFCEAGRLRSAACHDSKRVDRVYFDKTKSDLPSAANGNRFD